jgi:lipoprotein signal peptidase
MMIGWIDDDRSSSWHHVFTRGNKFGFIAGALLGSLYQAPIVVIHGLLLRFFHNSSECFHVTAGAKAGAIACRDRCKHI